MVPRRLTSTAPTQKTVDHSNVYDSEAIRHRPSNAQSVKGSRETRRETSRDEGADKRHPQQTSLLVRQPPLARSEEEAEEEHGRRCYLVRVAVAWERKK